MLNQNINYCKDFIPNNEFYITYLYIYINILVCIYFPMHSKIN